MNIEIQSIRFSADQKLLDFIHEKVGKLPHFYEDITGAEVYLKLENSNDRENKISELKIKTPGKILFAKGQASSFEKATDDSIEAMTRQLKKRKEKIRGN
jgi:ribosome hibernation promoting factor